MPRAILIVADSFGVGATPDAENFGDSGSDTLGHIAEKCSQNLANSDKRKGPLSLPNMESLGLGHAARYATGKFPLGFSSEKKKITGSFGIAKELSYGKDTPSGHWEIAGVPVDFKWGFFPKKQPTFPEEIITSLIKETKIPGILGNCHASGTDIISRLGEQHISTGKPICYTSSDSVFQIAAHESYFGLENLYKICKTCFNILKPYSIGRVIARPFVGECSKNFVRTSNRRDFSIPPHKKTLLERFCNVGGKVIAIGKVSDIYAHRGITKKVLASGNKNLFDAMLQEITLAEDNSIIFTNLIDFDMNFGHRRDVTGYARALEEFDSWIPKLKKILKKDDLVIITADHGCDPTWHGHDHTREYVPILAFGPNIKTISLGIRETFSDIGQTIANHLKIKPLSVGKSFF